MAEGAGMHGLGKLQRSVLADQCTRRHALCQPEGCFMLLLATSRLLEGANSRVTERVVNRKDGRDRLCWAKPQPSQTDAMIGSRAAGSEMFYYNDLLCVGGASVTWRWRPWRTHE